MRGRSASAAIVVFVTLLGAVVRLVAVPPEGRDLKPRPDALEYSVAAESLIERGKYAIELEGVDYPPRYPPGFPIAAAPFVAVDGIVGARRAAYWLGVATVSVTAVIGHIAGGPFGALGAGLVVALSPASARSSGVAMSETTSQLVWAIVLLFLTASRRESAGPGRRGLLLLAAGAIAFGTLVRYTNLALLPPLLLALIRRDPDGRRPSAFVAVSLCVALSGIAALLVRNALVFGHPFRDGYGFWVPELYGRSELLFSITYLVKPIEGLFTEGHLAVYGRALAGVGPALDPLYGWPVAILALVGLVRSGALARSRPSTAILFAAGTLALPAVFVFHLLYAWQDPRFLEPLVPLVAALAACALGVLGDAAREEGRSMGIAPVAAGLVCLAAIAYGPLRIVRQRMPSFSFDSGRWNVPEKRPLVDALAGLSPAVAGASIAIVDFETLLARRSIPRDVELVVADLESGDPHLARVADHDLHGLDGRQATAASLVRRGVVDESQVKRIADAVRGGARVVFVEAANEGARGDGIARLEAELTFVLLPQDADSPLALFELRPR